MEQIQKHTTGVIDHGYEFRVVGDYAAEYEEAMYEAKKGFDLHGDCLNKAWKMVELKPELWVIMGSLYVYNYNRSAMYGCEYKPSADVTKSEFHAWNYDPKRKIIVDCSLGGFILRGLDVIDDHGLILEGRSACMLAGKPEKWMDYRRHVAFTGPYWTKKSS